VHRVSIARFETGTRPSAETQAKIACALDVPVEHLWAHGEPRYLDGPRLVAWLCARASEPPELNESLARRFRAWRAGSRADVKVADRLLHSFALHLSDVPESIFID
jgi:transcriptional regulator with XRE-family HTH domain